MSSDTEITTGDAIIVIISLMIVIAIAGDLVWFIVDAVQQQRERFIILDQCWEYGWGKVVYVDGEYYCHGWEGGTESVRPLEWVQENACQ